MLSLFLFLFIFSVLVNSLRTIRVPSLSTFGWEARIMFSGLLFSVNELDCPIKVDCALPVIMQLERDRALKSCYAISHLL